MNNESMVTQAEIEDLGRCVGCNQLLRVGEVVTPWDDEVGHYDCNNPSSLERVPELDADPDCPPPFVLLGSPAQYVPLDKVQAAWSTRTAAQPEREAVALLRELRDNIGAASFARNPIGMSIRDRVDIFLRDAALTTPAPAVSRDEIVAGLGPYTVPIRRREDYSGEHREWVENYTIPQGDPLIREIATAILARLGEK